MPLPMGVANAGAKLILNDLLDSQVETAVSRLRADIPMAMVEGVAAFVVKLRPSSLIRRASSVEEVVSWWSMSLPRRRLPLRRCIEGGWWRG